MRNKSEKIEVPKEAEEFEYAITVARWVREEANFFISATSEIEAREIAREIVYDDDCHWERDWDAEVDIPDGIGVTVVRPPGIIREE